MIDFLEGIFGTDHTGILITGRISGRKGRGIDIQEFWVWPDEQERLESWYEKYHETKDLYFSPMLYSRKQRVKEAVEYTPVAYVDCDTAQPDTYALKPSITLETSPGRFQAYWVFDGPVSTTWAESMSRNITYSRKDAGSDVGGWALTKYMRIPGARNTKPRESGPFTVRLVDVGAEYSPSVLVAEFGGVDVSLSLGLKRGIPETLPDRAVTLTKLPSDADITRALTIAPAEHRWSHTLWWLNCSLFRAGLTPEEVFVVVRNCACDKYARDGRGEAPLWEEIIRAQKASASVGPVDITREELEVPEPPVELLTEDERVQVPRTFVDDYVEWASKRTSASLDYHVCGALTILSTILSEFGHAVPKFNDLKLNLWFMIVAPTTRTFKTTAKKLMLSVLHLNSDGPEPEYPYDIGGDASPEGLLNELFQHPSRSVLFHRDEAHSMLASAKGGKSYMSGFNEMLTELYDGTARGRLRATGQDKKMHSVPISFNLFLLGVPHELGRTLTRDDFASGFMARFVFAIGQPDYSKANMLEQAPVEGRQRVDDGYNALQDFILKMRYWWSNVTPPGDTIPIRVKEDAWDRLNTLIMQLDTLASKSDAPEVMFPCVDRLNKTVLKVACLLAMSRRSEVVEMPDMLAAIQHAESWYASLVTMTRIVGRSEFSGQVEDLVEYVQSNGGSVRLSKARRVFSNVEPRRWQDMLTSALEQQLIQSVRTNGTTFLKVWSD